MEPQSTVLSYRDRLLIVCVAIVQSVLLLLIHEGVEAEVAWLTAPMWRLCAYAAAASAPLAAMLSIGTLPMRRIILLTLGFAVVLALTGAYIGYWGDGGLRAQWTGVAAYVQAATLGVFIALPLAQVLSEGQSPRLPYSRLYARAWNNGLYLVLTGVFVGLFWLILLLWSALFTLIDIEFFKELFQRERFIYPVTGLVGGLGLTLFSGIDRIVAVNRRVLIAITKGLAPLLAFVTVLFLLFLVFRGVDALWDSGVAAALLLSLTLAQVLCIGAAYDDGDAAAPYPAALRWFVHLALALTPIYPALAAWAIGLRVEQYGWTSERVYAMVVTVVLGLYSTGYAVAVFYRASPLWLPRLALSNTAMAAVVVLACTLLASPVLDAQRIGVSDQVGRLLRGEVDSRAFDYGYLRFDGGRAGKEALERLAVLEDHPEAEDIRAAAQKVQEVVNRWQWHNLPALDKNGDINDWVKFDQVGHTVPDTFWSFLRARSVEYPERQCFEGADSYCRLVAVDLDGDERSEYVLFSNGWGCSYSSAMLFTQDEVGGWSRTGRLTHERQCRAQEDGISLDEIDRMVAEGDVEAIPARWQRLRVGEHVFKVEAD